MTADETEDAKLEEYLAKIAQPTLKRDAYTLVELMSRATGSSQGGGEHGRFRPVPLQVRQRSRGRRGTGRLRRPQSGDHLYMLDGVGAHAELLERLGPHTTGVGCLYLKDLAVVDLSVLEEMIKSSYEALTAGTYGLRAREGERRAN